MVLDTDSSVDTGVHIARGPHSGPFLYTLPLVSLLEIAAAEASRNRYTNISPLLVSLTLMDEDEFCIERRSFWAHHVHRTGGDYLKFKQSLEQARQRISKLAEDERDTVLKLAPTLVATLKEALEECVKSEDWWLSVSHLVDELLYLSESGLADACRSAGVEMDALRSSVKKREPGATVDSYDVYKIQRSVTTDITKRVHRGLVPLFNGREEARAFAVGRIDQLHSISQPCRIAVIGPRGSGKTTFVELLAADMRETQLRRRRRWKSGRMCRFLRLEVAELVMEADYATVTRTLRKAKAEAESLLREEVIAVFVFDGFGGVIRQPAFQAALKIIMDSPDFHVIVAAEAHDWQQIVSQDPVLLSDCYTIRLDDTDEQSVLTMLRGKAEQIDADFGVCTPEQVVAKARQLRNQSGSTLVDPGQTSHLLKKAAVNALRRAHETSSTSTATANVAPPPVIVEMVDLYRAVEQSSGIRISGADEKRSAELDEFQETIHRTILVHKQALTTIVDSFVSAERQAGRAEPMGCHLLAGPPGVGKATTAREIASLGFKNLDCLFTIRCQDWVGRSIAELNGDKSDDIEGRLCSHIRKYPRCVILIDGIEAGGPGLVRLVGDMAATGKLYDLQHRYHIDLHSCFIIVTTNIGQQHLSDKDSSSPGDHDSAMVQLNSFMPRIVSECKTVGFYGPSTQKAQVQLMLSIINEVTKDKAKVLGAKEVIVDDSVAQQLLAMARERGRDAVRVRWWVQHTLANIFDLIKHHHGGPQISEHTLVVYWTGNDHETADTAGSGELLLYVQIPDPQGYRGYREERLE